MKPAQWMGPAFPAFLARTGATPFDTDLAELGCQRPTAFAFTLAGNQSPVKHNRTAELQQNKTENRTAELQQNKTDNRTAGIQQNNTAGLQQNKTAPPATSGRSVDDLFVIAYQVYALVLGLLIAYLISTAV